jgi:hypothetical protein
VFKPPFDDELACLAGQIAALRTVLAVVVGTSSNREGILASVRQELPAALAQLEHDGWPIAAGAYEDTVEMVAEMARGPVEEVVLPPPPPGGSFR